MRRQKQFNYENKVLDDSTGDGRHDDGLVCK